MGEKIYVDVNESDLDHELLALVAAQRRTYEADKAARKALIEAANRKYALPAGKVIVGQHYTRWGQMQFSIDDKPVAKAPAKARPDLTEYLASVAERQH